ncbi:hypothetical protein EFY79_19625 [Hanamia caeni]|uniref:Uncharacterized protein n=1 Tax=Hanamia caeni TaxID=2294116 RepID=A0A3M9N4Z5_9BACT|nr:hypothetical protein EFY79_19625 [Hanamia caeni]
MKNSESDSEWKIFVNQVIRLCYSYREPLFLNGLISDFFINRKNKFPVIIRIKKRKNCLFTEWYL